MSGETPSTSGNEPEKIVETAPELTDQNQNVIFVGQIMVGPEPIPTTCPYCHDKIVTDIKKKADTKTHLFALSLCLVGLWPCCACFIPYRVNSCMSKKHYCPNCKAYLGSFSD